MMVGLVGQVGLLVLLLLGHLSPSPQSPPLTYPPTPAPIQNPNYLRMDTYGFHLFKNNSRMDLHTFLTWSVSSGSQDSACLRIKRGGGKSDRDSSGIITIFNRLKIWSENENLKLF